MSECNTSRHMCYILHNEKNSATYNGYTVDFDTRLRQHNCVIKGGARFTRKQVLSRAVVWLPLALVRVVDLPGRAPFDRRRALSCEWSIKYPDNRRPRPASFNGAMGRLCGLARVFANPKFADLTFLVQVFSMEAFAELASSLCRNCADRVTIEVVGADETIDGETAVDGAGAHNRT